VGLGIVIAFFIIDEQGSGQFSAKKVLSSTSFRCYNAFKGLLVVGSRLQDACCSFPQIGG
jgi:hypothetical protein